MQTSVNTAKGTLDGPRQTYQINANDQLARGADYRNVVVAYHNGAPVLLKDVAAIVDGVENTKQAAWMNQVPAVIVNVQRQPGANTISVAPPLKSFFPPLPATPPAPAPLTPPPHLPPPTPAP